MNRGDRLAGGKPEIDYRDREREKRRDFPAFKAQQAQEAADFEAADFEAAGTSVRPIPFPNPFPWHPPTCCSKYSSKGLTFSCVYRPFPRMLACTLS